VTSSVITWRDVFRTMGRGLDVSTPFDPYTLAHRDPSSVRALLPVFEQLARRYLRLNVTGARRTTKASEAVCSA
jgi:hypothetical protein